MNVTNKKRKLNDKKDWVVIPNTHEPIISREVFEQVQIIFEQKSQRGIGGTREQKHLFTNIVYCSDCGKGMWYHTGRSGYICGTYAKHGKNFCTNHAIKEQQLIDIILGDIKKMCNRLNTQI